MTPEQKTLEDIRKAVAEHPGREKITAIANLIRRLVETNGDLGPFALALVGAELAAC